RRWYHAVLGRDGESGRGFLDGKLEIEGEAEVTVPAGTGRGFFGGRNDRVAGLGGRIGEAAGYDRAPTAAGNGAGPSCSPEGRGGNDGFPLTPAARRAPRGRRGPGRAGGTACRQTPAPRRTRRPARRSSRSPGAPARRATAAAVAAAPP